VSDWEPEANGRDRLPDARSPGDEAQELPLTTAADVESAGRSCLAILVLGVVIVAILLLWVVARALGFGA
jgi:hypothetical protein